MFPNLRRSIAAADALVGRVLPALIASLAIGLMLAASDAAAGATSDADRISAVAVAPRLADRIQRDGTAAVIVQLRLPGPGFVPEGRLPGRAEVALQRREIAARGDQVLALLKGTHHRVHRRFQTVPFLALEIGPDALTRLQSAPVVARVVEDVVARASLAESVPRIGADKLWAQGFDGSGTVIAVLDTGVDSTHPFLANKVLEEACYSSTVGQRSTTLCPNGQEEQLGPGAGVNCSLSGCEHGTHVAGIAAGNGATAGKTFSGVAKGADLMAVQVFSRFNNFSDCGFLAPCIGAWSSDIIAGLERVYLLRDQYQFAAANLSLGEGLFSSNCDQEPYKPAIDNLRSVGIASVAASGNNGSTTSLTAPACISSAVSVGSTSDADTVSYFSNTSSFLSLLAPGESITSSVPGGGYDTFDGTSMAAPHVAGAFGVLRQGAAGATVTEILAALQQTGLPIADTRPGGTVTKPRIQVNRALPVLLPGRPFIDGVTPDRASPGQTVSVKVAGSNFQPGAQVGFGADIAVSGVSVDSSSQISATLAVAAGAALGKRDVTVTNPDGQAGVLSGGFTLSPPPPTLTLAYLGKLRDRVGKGNSAVSPDGALDGTFTLKLETGSGARTLTQLQLRRTDGAGGWDTIPSTTQWVLGAAAGLDAPLANTSTGSLTLALSEGQTTDLFAADLSPTLFVAGKTFRITANFSDGTTATADTTLG